jgi:hypothetical protein
MPDFCLQPKSPLDLRRIGVPDEANLRLGEGSGVAGFKAMLYQDYITGDRQYVLAFAGTDGPSDISDWYNNIVQGSGMGAPAQYVAAMLIGDKLATQSDIPAGNLIVTGHSLGGGLASAAAVVGGIRADTFNAAWLREETLREPDGMGGFRELYPGSLGRLAGAPGSVAAYYVDWDILTYFQRRASNVISIHPVGTLLELDGPHDAELAWADPIPLATLYLMYDLHLMPSVLYGLLVKENSFGRITIDMLGYDAYFGN